MTAYTTLSNTAVSVGGIPSGATVTAFRDNPIAIAEGTAGAPKILSRALGLDTGSGTVTTGVSAFTGLGDIAELIVATNLTVTVNNDTAEATARYRLSNDGGGSWGSYITTKSVPLTSNTNETKTESSAYLVDFSASDAIEFSCVITGTGTRSFNFAFWPVKGDT
jgi:hypothetical protein